MSNRAGIRRRAVVLARTRGRASPDGGVTALEATGGSTTTLIDTSNATPGGASSRLRKNDWLMLPDAAAEADRKRLIASYDGDARTYTIDSGTVWSQAAASGDDYLVLKDDPDAWDSAINEALREKLAFPRFDEFSPVSASRRIYQLSAAPISVSDIARLSQIWGVQRHNENEAANEERWLDMGHMGRSTVKPFEDEGTFYLEFGGRLPGLSDQLRLVTTQPYATLTDESTASNVEEYWAALATLMVMAEWLGDSEDPKDEWAKIGRRYAKAYEDRRRQNLGQFAFAQVQRTVTRPGGALVGGRAGRGGTSGHGGGSHRAL